jgi:probable HAF family extracellular repeat protein
VPIPLTGIGSPSHATGINDNGVIVGQWNNQAFRWVNGVITDIGTPAGCSLSHALAINNQGIITGRCGDQAFRWSPQTGMTLLPGLNGVGYAIDSFGRIAGIYWPSGNPHAAWWDPQNGLHDISAGFISSSAYGMNDLGQIVGGVGPAVLWDLAGTVTILTPGLDAGAVDINEKGLVVGQANLPAGGVTAFRWTASGGIDFLAGAWSTAAVSSKGRIVGQAPGGPFTWKGGKAWLLPQGTTLLAGASAVNSCGAIVGSARYADGDHAVLWVRRACDPDEPVKR